MLHQVEEQLEVLNQTASQINHLENQLLAARAGFHTSLSEQTDRLKALGIRLGRCVQLARPYYEARLTQISLLGQIQIATEKYNLATDTLASSRDALSRLEQSKCSSGTPLDLETLESINRAIGQVNTAMRNVTQSKTEHERLLKTYNDAERTLRQLERKHKSAIKKSRPYFFHKQLFEQRMQEAKLHVDVCSEKVKLCKSLYSEAMLELEHISETLHFSGRTSVADCNAHKFFEKDFDVDHIVRGQGVGADSPDFVESPVFSSPSHLHNNSACCPARSTSNSSLLRSSNKSPPFSGASQTQNHFSFLNDLLEHVQQARLELDAFQLTVNTSVEISESPSDLVFPFPDLITPADLSVESPVIHVCPTTQFGAQTTDDILPNL